MSPCGLVKNVPQPEDLRRRLQVGKDIDERARVETSGHSGSGEKRRAESGGRRADAVCQLSAGSAGRTSHRAKPKKVRERALRLVRKKYSGAEGERFGPTLAAEHLASEDKLVVHPETLRRWMLAEGLWSPARRRRAHRQRRERRAHFGELVQMDGSFHAWFEERGPEGCLMNMVDDATSTTLGRIGKE